MTGKSSNFLKIISHLWVGTLLFKYIFLVAIKFNTKILTIKKNINIYPLKKKN